MPEQKAKSVVRVGIIGAIYKSSATGREVRVAAR
jgi:hypothetical protein